MQRSKGTVGAFLKEVSIFYKKELKVPLEIYEAPLEFTQESQDSLAKLTSHTLFKRRMQIRGLRHYDTTKCPSQFLSITEYCKYWVLLGKMELSSSDFMKPRPPANVRRSQRNLVDENRTIPFDSFVLSRSKSIQEEMLDYGVWAPPWFSRIVCGLAGLEQRELRVNESIEITENQILPREPYIFRGLHVLSL